jgi:hypothetical protein
METDARIIFVRLLGEEVDVWRPVRARYVRRNTYRIVAQAYDAEVESWEFSPGDLVECELTIVQDGEILAAIRMADEYQ